MNNIYRVIKSLEGQLVEIEIVMPLSSGIGSSTRRFTGTIESAAENNFMVHEVLPIGTITIVLDYLYISFVQVSAGGPVSAKVHIDISEEVAVNWSED